MYDIECTCKINNGQPNYIFRYDKKINCYIMFKQRSFEFFRSFYFLLRSVDVARENSLNFIR